MISLTIDGQNVEVPVGTTVLQATRQAGIHIPTLCDHPSLKSYGGCRLCVVEVEGMRTLQASCTLPAFDGMVVQTGTEKVRQAREFVLTMIFSERNHFCMYCHKTAGDCELQNAAYDEEMTHWPIQPNWTPFPLDGTNPYFSFDHNRCILCRRCVRACSDLVGNSTLDVENRGANSKIVADYGLPIGESTCINCGTCVQICPTGALIDNHSAYLGKDADAEHISSVCVGCSVGCGIEMLVRDNQLMRIDGDWNAPVNNGLLCELGRYKSLVDDRERIRIPMVRKNGSLTPTSWEEAINAVAEQISMNSERNAKPIAAMASTRLPAETLYAFKSLFANGLSSDMVTSIEEHATMYEDIDNLEESDLEALKAADCVVAVGVNLFENHQVAGFFLKRNLYHGTRLVVIDPYRNSMEERAAKVIHPKAGSDQELFAGMISVILSEGLSPQKAPENFNGGIKPLPEIVEGTGVSEEDIRSISRMIAKAQRPVFVFGKGLTTHADSKEMRSLGKLAHLIGAAVITPRGKANSWAARSYGLDKFFEAKDRSAVYLALGDDHPTPRLMEQIKGAPFLAVQASHHSPATDLADVVLPVEMWAEQEGHYVNMEGRMQKASRALRSPNGIRSNLDVLQQLAAVLQTELDGNWEENLLQPVPAAAGVR